MRAKTMAPLHSAGLICLLFSLLLFSVGFAAAQEDIPNTIKHAGCPNRCGNVSIPYPFGIGYDCSVNPQFSFYCNVSTGLPNVRLTNDDTLEVIGISESSVQIKTPRYVYCYDEKMILNLSGSPFTLSDANVVTQLGCSDTAVLEGYSSQYLPSYLTNNNFASGCVSFCVEGNKSNINGSCPGNGCCQSPLPKGTVFINLTNADLEGSRWNRMDVPCSYSFIGERKKFTFPTLDLDEGDPSPVKIYDLVENSSIILDWRVGSENCSRAMNSSSEYACQNNTLCIDDDAGFGGYRCSCVNGYEGNPYLPPGCHDINECESKEQPCHRAEICINVPGSYNCFLPSTSSNTKLLIGLWVINIAFAWLTLNFKQGCFRPRKSMSLLFTGVVCAMSLLTGIPFYFGLRKYVKKRKNRIRRQQCFKQNGGLLLQQKIASSGQGTLDKTVIFSAKELQKATDNFNESRILGRGGQGTVYKGMLSDGQIVAIKKSQLVDEKKSESLVEQFINEVVILSQINHRNVVKLLGCCLETNVPLLVYEFVANGTLHQHIHEDRNVEFPISWSMRLKIAAEIAGALAYLHSATTRLIFHRDIKSSNILLDEKYVAKVSDFGASKTVAIDQTHLTTNVNGTFGYIDPEYFQSSQFTEKSDVYSFGVVLVELLTGEKPVMYSPRSSEHRSLVQHFLSAMNENNLVLILDSQVAAESENKYPLAVARLAKRCLNLNGKKRPTMKAVAMELENIRMARMGSVAQTRIARDEQHPSLHYQEGSPALLSTDICDDDWTSTTNQFHN